jgi:hypothetical protein
MVYLGQQNNDAGTSLIHSPGVSHQEGSPMAQPQYTPVRSCLAPGCEKPARPHSRYCAMHESRLRKRGTLDAPVRPAVCSVEGEMWRPVVGYEGLYDVSRLGRIRTVENPSQGRFARNRSLSVNQHGYLVVGLCRDGTRLMHRVHRLVAAAFIGPCPAGRVVHHIDHNRSNACAANLMYVTQQENTRLSFAAGRVRKRSAAIARTRCQRGHEMSDENTHVDRNGRRRCRTCRRETERTRDKERQRVWREWRAKG